MNIQHTCNVHAFRFIWLFQTLLYSIEHAHLSIVFSTSDHIPTLLKLASKVPMLKTIVCINIISPEAARVLKEWSQTLGLSFKLFSEGLWTIFLVLTQLTRHSGGIRKGKHYWAYSCLPRFGSIDLLYFGALYAIKGRNSTNWTTTLGHHQQPQRYKLLK